MKKLIKFEIYRNRKKMALFLVCILLANLFLVLLDPDLEKATTTISILIIVLPFMFMCMDFTKMLVHDFYKDTKYLYLSSSRTKKEILGTKLLTTATYALVYIITVSLFQKVNILGILAFKFSLGFSLIVLFANNIIVLTVYKKTIG